MTIEQLSSVIYNNVVSGIEGNHVDRKFSQAQIEDDIVNERLTIIKEYALKGILPANDLMIKINCVTLDDEPINRVGEFEEFDGYYVKHFQIPQVAFVYDKESIGYIGNINGKDSFPIYVDRHAWFNHRFKRFVRQRPHVFVDFATNTNNMYDGWIVSKTALPEDMLIAVIAIWKDPRDLINFQCCSNEEINNWTFISTEIIKRLTEKYLRYYRMFYQPPTPTLVNQ